MPKLLLATGCFILFCNTIFAQVVKSDTSINQSLLEDELSDLLINKPSKSYFDFVLGIGNKLFSVKNNAVNSTQIEVNKLFYTGAISYHNKSGLNIAVMPYLSNDGGSLKVNQTAITPSYNYSGAKVDVGISYTRYLSNYKSYNSNATFQNDFYTSIKLVKPFLQPLLAIGYSTGTYKQINFDTLRNFNNRIIKDSTSNNVKNFTTSFGVEHSFGFDHVFHSDAQILLSPQLLLIAGNGKLATTHTNKNYSLLINKSKKVKSRTVNSNDAFKLQSFAFSLDASYNIGKFSLSPNLYLDYYLPSTTDKRITTVYSIAAGISF